MSAFQQQIDGCSGQLDALRTEFGAVLADRIMQSELVDFIWPARLKERYLGQQEHCSNAWSEEPEELSRIAVLSRLDHNLFVAMCLVDGDGEAAELIWHRSFERQRDAEIAFEQAR